MPCSIAFRMFPMEDSVSASCERSAGGCYVFLLLHNKNCIDEPVNLLFIHDVLHGQADDNTFNLVLADRFLIAVLLHHPSCLRRFPTQALPVHAACFAEASCREDKADNLQQVWATYCGLKHIRQPRHPCWRKE